MLGARGIGLAVLVMVLVGNALSGAATSPDLLPTGFGQLGQLLPAGATASHFRSTSGFDGIGATGPVLAVWALAGTCAAAFGKAAIGGHSPAPSTPTMATDPAPFRPRDPSPAIG